MIEEITKYDSNFNEAMFLTKVDHTFIMILSAIMDNDMSSVKHFLDDPIYEKFNTLVESYKEKGLTRLFDDMNVKSTSISNVIIDIVLLSHIKYPIIPIIIINTIIIGINIFFFIVSPNIIIS